jgi:RNA-directed DNA polymerase
MLFLHRMSDQPITKYRSKTHPHPYLTGNWATTIAEAETPIPNDVWQGNAENNEEWRLVKEEIMATQRTSIFITSKLVGTADGM